MEKKIDTEKLKKAIINSFISVFKIKHHYLKTETEYFQALENNLKKFELRKNDRDFKIGDFIYLHETVNGTYTGRKLASKKIKYIFHGGKYGLEDGYCILCW